MKKCILSLALVLAMLLGLLPTAAFAAGGSGTEVDPIRIESAQELAALAAAGDDYTGKFIKLTENIDLSDIYNETTGTSWEPIGQSTGASFNGTFDGDGHTVSGLYIAAEKPGNYGLFGAIGSAGTVKGLTVEGSVTGPSNMGGVAGVNYGTITDCHSTAAVTGNGNMAHIGGIAGENHGTIARCSNSGAVECTYTPGQDGSATVMVGGIAGYNEVTILNCYNVGSISSSAEGYIGGVAGFNSSGTVENCYNASTVRSDAATPHGLCSGGTVINSYYDKIKVSDTSDGGISGDAFMDLDKYFTGWDFITVWRMDAALKRPVLRAPGDPDAHVHPVCGSGRCTHESPHSNIVWTQWTNGTALPNYVGNFYLTTDVTLSDEWRPASGARLCLNGHSITQNTPSTLALLINEGAVFDLCDCTGGAAAGTVTSNGREGVSCLGDFSLYGGTISGNTAASGVELISGTFHMYGGLIRNNGGAALTSGGGVNVQGGTFYLHGGEITGNTAKTGGGVSVGRGGAFTMLGGEITGNTATGFCGGVAFTNDGTLTVGGQVVIAENTVGGQPSNFGADYDTKIAISQALTQGARIGVIPYDEPPTADRPLDVTTENNNDYSAYFHSDDPAYEIVNGANNVVQLIPYVKYRISQQPAADNEYTVVAQEKTENGEWVNATSASYQWYETEHKVYPVADAANAVPEGALGASVNAGTDAGSGTWDSVNGMIVLQFAALTAGDTVTAVPSANFSGDCIAIGPDGLAMPSSGADGAYSYVMPADGELTFGLQAEQEEDVFSATITVTRTTSTLVADQNTPTLGITWGGKTYVCAVTFEGGTVLTSNAVTVPLFQGDGTEANPYLIPDLAALEGFRDYINAGNGHGEHFRLTADVDLAGVYSEDTGTSWTPIGTGTASFSGTFDGYGHTVQNLYINTAEAGYVGLFGTVDGTGTVKNLKVSGILKAVDCNGKEHFTGGVAGQSQGAILNCHSACTVEGTGWVGGIVGQNDGTVEGCHNTGTVTVLVTGSATTVFHYAGGIAASNTGVIQRCYNTGDIQGVYTDAFDPGPGNRGVVILGLGGVAGATTGAIENCYNTGAVTATANDNYVGYFGGVTGQTAGNGRVENCYGFGGVTGPESASIGGVVGSGDSPVTSSYYDSAKVTSTNPDPEGTGIPADSFQVLATFVDWDFSATWELDTVLGRPVLRTPDHIHQWTYTADGAAISQLECAAAGCHLSGGGSVTLVAPTEDLVYNGNAHDATLTGAFQVLALPQITYQHSDTEFGTYADVPNTTAAGWYRASITVEGEMVAVTYQVAKATPTVDTPQGLTARYGQTLSDVALPQGWAWNDPSTDVGDVGENTFPATYTPDDPDNYNTVAQNLTVTVEKATPIMETPQGLTAYYGQTLSDVALPQGWAWDEPSTSVGTVGENTFPATFTPDDTVNYNTVAQNLTVTVEPAPENAPSIRIDYEKETLTGFEVDARYAIGGEEVRPEEGTLPIIAAYLDQQLSIVRLARDGNHADSEASLLSVPPRPGPP